MSFWWQTVLAINVLTFLLFGWDKWRASRGGSRVPEFHLLLLTALSGAPGGWLGGQLFRHKTRKASFRVKFALASLVNVLWLYLWWRSEREATS